MIKTVTMYSVVCNRCGKTFIDEFNGIGAWLDEGTAKEQAIGWTKLKGEIEYSFITDVDDTINYSDAIKEYTFADGTPFGIKEEE